MAWAVAVVFGCGSPASAPASASGDAAGGDDARGHDASADTGTPVDAGPLTDTTDDVIALPDALALIDGDDGAGPEASGESKTCILEHDQCIWVPDDKPLDAGSDAPGGCGAGQFDAGGTCKPASCTALAEYAYQALFDDIAASGAQKCKSDDECVAVDIHTACAPRCPIAVHASAAAKYAKLASSIDSDICIPFAYAAVCDPNAPALKCKPPTPGCVNGSCHPHKVYPSTNCKPPGPDHASCYDGKWLCDKGWTRPPGSEVCVQATCIAMETAVHGALLKAIEVAAKGCTADADCATVPPNPGCGGACTAAVTKANKNKFLVYLSALTGYCKGNFNALGCTQTPPEGCAAAKAGCVAGSCTVDW